VLCFGFTRMCFTSQCVYLCESVCMTFVSVYDEDCSVWGLDVANIVITVVEEIMTTEEVRDATHTCPCARTQSCKSVCLRRVSPK